MENPTAAAARGWWRCARRDDFPEAYLLWMMPVLIMFDDDSTLASSLIAALAVLLMGAVFWADGRGRAESWAETVFAFGWMGVWSLAAGLLLLDRGPGDLGGLWAALSLAAGAAVLAWSWAGRRRRPLERTQGRAVAGVGTVVWLGVGALLSLLVLAAESPRFADVAVLALASLLCLLLAPRGRAAGACGGWR